jgi:hypothetical protein
MRMKKLLPMQLRRHHGLLVYGKLLQLMALQKENK